METEISEKESSSKSKVAPRIIVAITLVAIVFIAVVALFIKAMVNNDDVVAPTEKSVSMESLLQESRERGFEPVADSERSNEKDGEISSLNFDVKAKGSSCFFTMEWTASERWTLTKQASSLNHGNDFKLSNPDLPTLQRIDDFADCFTQTPTKPPN